MDVLRSELTKAKSASKQPPLDVEIDQCRKYIARGETHQGAGFPARTRVCSAHRGPGAPREIGERTVSSPHHGSSSRLRRRGHVTPADGEHVAIRARHSCEGVARSQIWGRRPRHSSSGEETSRFEAGRFRDGILGAPHPMMPQCVPNDVARSPSRTARGFVAGRSATRVGSVMAEGVNHLIEITKVQPSAVANMIVS